MLTVDLAHDQLGKRSTRPVIFHRKLAAQPRDDGRRGAPDRDEDRVVEVSAADSVHTDMCERSGNKGKREIRSYAD